MPNQSLKQRTDKRYRAWYKGKQFYGSTQREARSKRDEYRRQVEAGLNISEAGVSVGEYCARWVETYKASVSEKSRLSYRTRLARFCRFEVKKLQIGHMALKSVTASDIQAFFNTLSGMSFSSVSQHVIAVKAVFRSAIADRIITFDPTANTKPPKAPEGTHRTITQEERALIHSVPHKLQPITLVMLYAGLRSGEALALDIDRDIDFEKKLIHVRCAVSWQRDGKGVISSTKTESGVRDVPLLDVLAPALKELHGPLLQCGCRSSWFSMWQSYMRALSKAADQEVYFRPHDLRHTYCTMLYDAGVDIKSAQTWMGHASLQVTLAIYTHLSEERKASSTDALEKEAQRLATVQNTVQNREEAAKSADK